MKIERIGDCTLYLGDCLEVLPTLEAGSVNAVVTDPPYGIGFPYFGYTDTREALKSLITAFVPMCRDICDRMFILCGPTQICLYPQSDWVGCITWNTTGTFGKFGYNQWTPVLCYGKDLKGFGNVNGVTKADTIRISGGAGVGFMRTDAEKKHTCPKPLNLMELVVNRNTAPASVVLDPFMGSGTTGVACVNTGRKFIGIERSPEYFAIACDRIQKAYAARPALLEAV